MMLSVVATASAWTMLASVKRTGPGHTVPHSLCKMSLRGAWIRNAEDMAAVTLASAVVIRDGLA